MTRTIIVRRNYAHYIKKYARCEIWRVEGLCLLPLHVGSWHRRLSPTQAAAGHRYEKRHGNIPAHVSPCFRVSEGDTVIIGQCRCGFAIHVCLEWQQSSCGLRDPLCMLYAFMHTGSCAPLKSRVFLGWGSSLMSLMHGPL